jgi:hypothetical protein
MALSSDEIIKREIVDHVGGKVGDLSVRAFPEESGQDQNRFQDGGLTFSHKGTDYGSCDLAYIRKNDKGEENAVIAIEGTDALNRGSGGNAQYQRFHHALGAVKNGIIGIYYLRPGKLKLRKDLYAMAYHATKLERGCYLITTDLDRIKSIVELCTKDKRELQKFITSYSKQHYNEFLKEFDSKYNSDWNEFAKKRSTIIKDTYVIKHAARMRRNFTDGDQRAGHIAVGEMYLSKYFFIDKKLFYLWPRMTREDIEYLDIHKTSDKEWHLLRNEPNVEVVTIDNISNVPLTTKRELHLLRDSPLKGVKLKRYNICKETIHKGLVSGSMSIINISSM